VVGPDGRVTERADAGMVVGRIRATARPTVYVRTGDWMGPAAVLLLLGALIAL
jgi:apolipoprotein N-acyltransferase